VCVCERESERGKRRKETKMKTVGCVIVAMMVVATNAVTIFDYSKSYKVGEWSPPEPPAKELGMMKHPKVPAPENALNSEGFKFSEVGNNVAFRAGNRKLMMEGGEAVKGSKVPHNWFGQGKYVAPTYEIMTGKEECDVCFAMLEDGADSVVKEPTGEGAEAAEGAEGAGAQDDLCNGLDPKYKDVCQGYSKYLQDCPAYQHNICHQDMGGAEMLRSPCPHHLKCYYCLRINPLYCFDDD